MNSLAEILIAAVFIVAMTWALSTVIRGVGPGPGDGGVN